MYPRSDQSFPIFSHICQNRRLLGSGNVRMLLNPKRLQQKVSMHFPTAQNLMNNIKNLPLAHEGKWSNYDVKEMTFKTRIPAFRLWVIG